MSVIHQSSKQYWEALKEVMDPEFPISVVDMGLIRNIEQPEEGVIKVTMTYTSTGCACMVWIESDIKERLLSEEEVKEVEIEVQWDPAWTVHDMTEEGRNKMQNWGVRS
ncbi:metal-sulfur cluster assembly factor [Halobacillus ihumii]|uniref:metal-sulfur cluster assembly factor n=1 Tax=Halobacillus ihumii TaxID=2686092 RepID=UPI00196720F3|nr:metal-sulfur cluster assembly factor [Halobacillus ihumii]